MIKLAVMSDLHIGLAARGKDLCPEPPKSSRKERSKYHNKTDNTYRQKFLQFIQQKEITADYLVLPGDITNKALPEEVEIASEFVLQAADALTVKQDKIVFTPGNHDVDWLVSGQADRTGVRWGQRYDSIGHSNFHFRTQINRGEGDILASSYFTAWNFKDLVVIGYNSASHDNRITEEVAHHGLADPDHLEDIHQYLQDIGDADERVRLFLVHHHSIDFPNPIPTTPDFSQMTNAGNLLSLLHDHRFDILVHGHKHFPYFETHSTQTYPPIPILCSGSFSVEIDTQWAGTVDNQFHIVLLNDRSGSSNQITGKITSWTNNRARGWIPSEESTSGIHHIIPFGNYLMPNELDARLEPYITKWLTKHDHILWTQILEQFNDLEHLPLKSAMAAFERIGQKLGRLTMFETLKDLILY
jgi:3',5'-cyclic AMP phosphodiesterase CpdA